MIDLNKIVYISTLSGFGNYKPPVSFSVVMASQSLAAGNYIGPSSASVNLDNSDAVSQIQVTFSGLDAFTRVLPGVVIVNYPNNASPTYQIQVMSYYAGGKLHVDAYLINQTGGTITTPAVTFACTASLFQAPF